jgi:hypothetical protein
MKKLFFIPANQMKSALVLIFTLSLFILSCAKKGPEGPAGPNGVAGPQGAQGVQGAVGAQGPQGNANVTSGTVTFTNADYKSDYWSITTGPSSSLGLGAKKATVSVASITAAIFNTGTVLVYFKVPVGLTSTLTGWSQLPFSLKSFDGNYFISLKNNYEIGKVNIYYLYEQTNSAASVPNIFSATVPDYTFKYIVIAGTAGGRQKKPTLDYSDYAAVCKYYGIPE